MSHTCDKHITENWG